MGAAGEDYVGTLLREPSSDGQPDATCPASDDGGEAREGDWVHFRISDTVGSILPWCLSKWFTQLDGGCRSVAGRDRGLSTRSFQILVSSICLQLLTQHVLEVWTNHTRMQGSNV